jgi:AcrR family transcriptional regulator
MARTRNAADTRQAILTSARRCFAESGYDGAGVREIAAGAGVTAMLVNRYFGSKEQLFAEAIAAAMTTPSILAQANLGAADMAPRMAATLIEITKPGAIPLEGFLIMLKSASSKRAAELGREQIEAHYQRTLTHALGGELAAQRAAVFLALVAGIQVMRQMIGLTALTDATPDQLERVLTPLVAQLATG